jgi:hypothetical protein
MDHLEHLAECGVCEAADEMDTVLSLVDFETDMLVEEEGYNPTLTRLWDQELQRNELISAATEETRKYYAAEASGEVGGDIPPRPDTE